MATAVRVTGIIFALDLGSRRSGFAKGRPGEKPVSGTAVLKKDHERRAVALGNLVAFLDAEWRKDKPSLVVTEAPPALQGFANMGNSEATVRATYGLHAIVEALCARHGILHDEVHDATARKHFLGKGRMGDRQETKNAVIARCHLLGLMPKDCRDDNRADALCVHDWACANYGSRSVSMNTLHLFGETAA